MIGQALTTTKCAQACRQTLVSLIRQVLVAPDQYDSMFLAALETVLILISPLEIDFTSESMLKMETVAVELTLAMRHPIIAVFNDYGPHGTWFRQGRQAVHTPEH